MLLQLNVNPSIGLELRAWASLWTSDAPFHGPIGKFLHNLILTIFLGGSSSPVTVRSLLWPCCGFLW